MIKDLNYIIEPAKDGNPCLIVRQNGKDIPLHSRINPLKESDAAGYELAPEKFDLLIVLGCGLGYNLIKLKEYAGRFSQIVIIDILQGIENEIAKNPHASFLCVEKNIFILSGMDIEKLILPSGENFSLRTPASSGLSGPHAFLLIIFRRFSVQFESTSL